MFLGLRHPALIDSEEEPQDVGLLHHRGIQLRDLNHDVSERLFVSPRQLEPRLAFIGKAPLGKIHDGAEPLLAVHDLKTVLRVRIFESDKLADVHAVEDRLDKPLFVPQRPHVAALVVRAVDEATTVRRVHKAVETRLRVLRLDARAAELRILDRLDGVDVAPPANARQTPIVIVRLAVVLAPVVERDHDQLPVTMNLLDAAVWHPTVDDLLTHLVGVVDGGRMVVRVMDAPLLPLTDEEFLPRLWLHNLRLSFSLR